MSKSPCKGIRKDGSPCRGHGLDQFDGLCIAHGPSADQAHQWRSLGGKNSATAARIDKRIPERFKGMLDLLDDGMKQVKEGTLSPAAYTAICRGAKVQLEVYRLADEEMDLIRTEETQTAAAEIAGAPANLDILEAAADTAAQQDRYRSESLVAQGYAEFREPSNPDDQPQVVLNGKGRERLGYRSLDINQDFLNEVDDQLTEYDPEKYPLPDTREINDLLDTLVADTKMNQAQIARVDAGPFDPLTGQPMTKLPAGVKVDAMPLPSTRCNEPPQEVMQDHLRHIDELRRATQKLSEDKDYTRRRAEQEDTRIKRDGLAAFLDTQEAKGLLSDPPPQLPSWQ